jgi:hypothetical protein
LRDDNTAKQKQTGSLNMAAIYQVGGDHSFKRSLDQIMPLLYKVIMETGLINIKGDLNNATVFKMIYLLEDLMKRDNLKEVIVI